MCIGPYFRTLYSLLRFTAIRLFTCHKFEFGVVQLFSRQSRFVFSKNSMVKFGSRIYNDGYLSIIVDNGQLTIGNNVYFNSGANVSVKSKVTIGDGCQMGPNVSIFDNNHEFNANEGVKLSHRSAPICIGDHCWIGANCVILKGTTIGRNTVIGAGCVVYGDIPECSIVTQGRELCITPMRR